jgi:hypothetical protein
MPSLRERIRGLWVFGVAASAAPLSYLISIPCGGACFSCPMTGACLLATPLVVLLVLAVKFSRRIKSFFSRAIR